MSRINDETAAFVTTRAGVVDASLVFTRRQPQNRMPLDLIAAENGFGNQLPLLSAIRVRVSRYGTESALILCGCDEGADHSAVVFRCFVIQYI